MNPWYRRLRKIAERLAVAHFIAYPIAMIWAVAAIPLTIHLFIDDLDRLDGNDAVGAFVVRKLLWPAATAFVLAHTAAIPWLVAGDPRAGFRRCISVLAGLAGGGILCGGASWLWLHLR